MKNISFSLILSTLICLAVNGQVRQPHSLYFMETIPQISQVNPAHQPRANGYVILPLNFNIDLMSDIAVKDVFQQKGNNWYTPLEEQYEYKKLRNSIGKKATMVNLGLDWDIFGFGFRAGNGYVSFGLSQHITGGFALPSDLFKITEDFFPDRTKLDFSPLRAKALMYTQLRFGYSGKINENLTVGINVKPLMGQAAATSQFEKSSIRTGVDKWVFDSEGTLKFSGPVELELDDEGKISDSKSTLDDLEDMDILKKYLFDFSNPGIAFDFGAEYRINDRLTASAALNNLGFISWKNDLNGITYNGSYEFDGMDFDVAKDDNDFDFDEIADAMNYEVNHDKFKTGLAPSLNLGASYMLTKAVSAGFTSRTVFWQNAVRQSFNMSLYVQPYSFVAFNAGATYQLKGNVYLGGGFMFLLGPLQFYLLGDYAPVYLSTVRFDTDKETGSETKYIPLRQKSFTYRLGFNLIFGRHGYVDKPMLNKGKSSWN